MARRNGRLIVITGVTRGLGKAMAAGFIGRGHTVAGCGRRRSAIAELADRHSRPHDFAVVDVASDDEVRAWSRRLLVEFGPPGLLINNAAIINRNAPLWQVSRDEFDQVMAINVCGTANVIRHFVPAMVAEKQGIIINFSSGWGRTTAAEVAPYCASKFAVEGLTRALAAELPAGMAAVPLNPGIIDTEMLRSCFGPSARSYPPADQWAERAVPFLLGLGSKDNGKSLSVP